MAEMYSKNKGLCGIDLYSYGGCPIVLTFLLQWFPHMHSFLLYMYTDILLTHRQNIQGK